MRRELHAVSRTAQTTPEVMSATAGQDTDSTLMDVDVTVLHNLFTADQLLKKSDETYQLLAMCYNNKQH